METNQFTPRIRTIQKAAELIKNADPETEITEYSIRRLAKEEKIRSIKTGVKVLVDYDSLLAYLGGQVYSVKNEQLSI